MDVYFCIIYNLLLSASKSRLVSSSRDSTKCTTADGSTDVILLQLQLSKIPLSDFYFSMYT